MFNLPAVTTSQLWSTAGAVSYVYRFEHESAKPAKGNFLGGLSVFSSGSSTPKEESGIVPSHLQIFLIFWQTLPYNIVIISAAVSHGDDLLYLFELQTLEGKKVQDALLQDQKDLKVKNIFVNVVAEFLHNGLVYLNLEA